MLPEEDTGTLDMDMDIMSTTELGPEFRRGVPGCDFFRSDELERGRVA